MRAMVFPWHCVHAAALLHVFAMTRLAFIYETNHTPRVQAIKQAVSLFKYSGTFTFAITLANAIRLYSVILFYCCIGTIAEVAGIQSLDWLRQMH